MVMICASAKSKMDGRKEGRRTEGRNKLRRKNAEEETNNQKHKANYFHDENT